MRLSSKKILLFLFTMLLIFAVAVVTACNGAQEPNDTKTAMAAPQIELTGNVISWDSVEHAGSYEIYENSTLVKTVTENSYEIVKTAKGTYKYKIKALSADKNYSSSKFSNEVIYVVNNDKLSAPKIAISDGVITWESVEHADGYEIFENGELVSSQAETSYTIQKTETGTYKYAVKSTSTSSDYSTSELSNEVTHIISEQLATPQISIEGKVISWQAVAHAETYVIYENGVVIYQSWNRTSYEIEQTVVGDYIYFVVARSGNPAYEMSGNSNTVSYTVEPTALATPSDLAVDGNLLSWTESEGAGTYEIYEDDIIVAKQAHSPYQIPIDHEPGTFSFTVKAFPAKNDKQYLESEVSEPLIHEVSDDRTQLAAPTIRYETREEYKNPGNEDLTRPDEEKVTKEYIVWDAVPNAGAYFVYEDGNRIAATQSAEYVISEFMPGNHNYQVRAIATSADFKSSELSEVYTHHINEDKNTAFTINLGLNYAPGFNSSVDVALYPIQQYGLPSDNPIPNTKRTLTPGQLSITINYTNIGRYVAKVTNLPSDYYASEVQLSAAATDGTINIYSIKSIRGIQLNTEVTLFAASGLGGNVGIEQEMLFVAPEKGQYQIVANNGLLCTVGGVESYLFVADKGEAVYVTANCQNAGQSKLKITKMAKQYINFGEMGFDGPIGQHNTIYAWQTEATFYLRASSEAKRYTIMFTTATMSNTRFAILTVNGQSYEFDGAYCTTQNITIPRSDTDIEITVKISGNAADEGMSNVAFYVIPL